MSNIKKTLKQHDEWIAKLEQIVADYPNSEIYREYLGKAKVVRQLTASQIGRKSAT